MKDPALRRRYVAASAIVIQLCLGTVYAWSIFKKPMMSANLWADPDPDRLHDQFRHVRLPSRSGDNGGPDSPQDYGALGGILFGTGSFFQVWPTA
jgi:OFA family oxalate/formate antiporter-like MFS transporter